MKWLDWKSCYNVPIKPFVVPEAMSHPAKMSIALCRRIFAFMEDEGMIRPGDVIVDPFGGIGTTALVGGPRGYVVILVELESKYVALARRNINKNRRFFQVRKTIIPIILQGDSRQLSRIVSGIGGVVTSPPFLATRGGAKGIVTQGYRNPKKRKGTYNVGKRIYQKEKFSHESIDRLPEGNISAVVTSPPFNENKSNVIHGQTKGFHSYDANESKNRMKRDYQEGQDPANIGKLSIDGKDKGIDGVITSPPYSEIRMDGGSTRPGYTGLAPYSGEERKTWRTQRDQTNLGNLPEGNVDGVVTSPPYESAGTKADENPANYIRRDQERYELMKARGIRRPKQSPGRYSGSRENIGNQNAETYWAAMDVVYRECWKILKPQGAWLCVVVKDFVRNKKRVPLCDNTVKLLQYIGFKVAYRARAWLRDDLAMKDMFSGAASYKERKSFFRRDREQKIREEKQWLKVSGDLQSSYLLAAKQWLIKEWNQRVPKERIGKPSYERPARVLQVAQSLAFKDFRKRQGNPDLYDDERHINFEEVIFAQKL